jgi:hypothetical protein
MSFTICKYLFSGNYDVINILFIINLYTYTWLSVLNDRLCYYKKLNQVHKQQLLNKKLHEEIIKLNNKFNNIFKKES